MFSLNRNMKDGIRLVINKLFYTEIGQIITSALFGLALALLFKRVCKNNCTKYYAPYIDEIQNKIFKLEDTCYKYFPYMVKCPNDNNILSPYDINSKPLNKIEIKSNINNN